MQADVITALTNLGFLVMERQGEVGWGMAEVVYHRESVMMVQP